MVKGILKVHVYPQSLRHMPLLERFSTVNVNINVTCSNSWFQCIVSIVIVVCHIRNPGGQTNFVWFFSFHIIPQKGMDTRVQQLLLSCSPTHHTSSCLARLVTVPRLLSACFVNKFGRACCWSKQLTFFIRQYIKSVQTVPLLRKRSLICITSTIDCKACSSLFNFVVSFCSMVFAQLHWKWSTVLIICRECLSNYTAIISNRLTLSECCHGHYCIGNNHWGTIILNSVPYN